MLGALNPNPRTIDNKHLEMLKKSLIEFGDLSGFVYNIKARNLVSGHQRQKVLPKDSEIVILNRYSPPTPSGTVADGYAVINGEKFKYREVDWTREKADAAMIAANQHGGEFEKNTLKEILSELKFFEMDMDLTGFTEAELPKLIMFDVDSVNKGDENSEWVDMPEFTKGDSFHKIILCFKTEDERAAFAEANNYTAEKVYNNQWILYK